MRVKVIVGSYLDSRLGRFTEVVNSSDKSLAHELEEEYNIGGLMMLITYRIYMCSLHKVMLYSFETFTREFQRFNNFDGPTVCTVDPG